jgi:O-antigen ligase
MKMEKQDDLLEAMGPRGTQIAIVQQNWYKSPIFGFGPDAFKDRFNYHLEVHNTYLGLLIQHGILGLACILGVLGIIAYSLLKRIFEEPDWERRQFLIGLLAALAMLYLYGMFTFGLRQRIFWVVLGLATATMRSRPRPAQPVLTAYRGAVI